MNAFDIVEEPIAGQIYCVQRRLNGPAATRFEPATINTVSSVDDGRVRKRLSVYFLFDGKHDEIDFAIGTVRKLTDDWVALQRETLSQEEQRINTKREVLEWVSKLKQ